MPNIQVVVPAFDDGTYVIPLLRALNNQAEETDKLGVIISDDGSPRPLKEIVEAGPDYEHLIVKCQRGPNSGPGAARNRGVDGASAEWVVFLDADTLPADGWLQKLKELIAENPSVDVIEGVTDYLGDLPSPFSHATEIGPAIGAGGANIAYRRERLVEIGGFDEGFYDPKRAFHFREDAELHYRALEAGLEILSATDLIIFHPPLKASYLTPVRLARRYYFDPKLSKRHPAAFREMNQFRKIGPFSLRYLRHLAAIGFVFGLLSTLATAWRPGLSRILGLATLVFWGANVGALTWRRRVSVKDILPALIVAALTPFVYTANYYRGVVKFGHLPRLR